MTFEEELVGLRPHLFRQAMKLARTIDGAEDLLQDTMVRALTNRTQFRPGTNLAAWTFTILRNQFISSKRRDGRILDDPDDHHTMAMAMDAPQEPREDFRDFLDAFITLPLKMQQALYLVGLLGHEYGEAAEMLDLPEGTIKSRVSRARTKLEKALT
ncbi:MULTISPECIES: sigma-70 family RNA polymerase sigma factor [unclassified Mesorhizobium]|uniref:sigma-70 family RNA polymerase sigma factor n=1 Tax=unclassified Mesorhizobium TaxID=325217 RepID=UPI00112E0197|nr:MULTISPECIES: sigma-70 family RNA polymerase sigma factor [unclassified Mesorhizobium]TPJ51634.1 sigma-70 family RNA polymerase sigma factor [Mesorhizobium sp. B2-6-4]TPN42312.1 sigma-70 family RNA polymerase sigma factor [Mesorhizobium sp. B1-1-6]